jgi:Nif11 domain
MSGSNLADFIQALKSDPALKERVMQAEREAMTNIRRKADAITAVAGDAGFDLSEWAKRPTDGKYTPPDEAVKTKDDCNLTCCLVATSTL